MRFRGGKEEIRPIGPIGPIGIIGLIVLAAADSGYQYNLLVSFVG